MADPDSSTNIFTQKESATIINKIYGDLNYYDVYGGSVIIFIILIIILFLVCTYTVVMKNVQPIKDNWATERCNPKYLPFAGFINKPEGVSAVEYTEQNFNYCMQNVLTSITGYAVEPLTYITSGITEVYSGIADSMNAIRGVISNVRTNIAKIAQDILGKIMNVMTPLQTMVISFNDMANKVSGILTAGLYTSLGTYYMLQTLVGAILQLIVIILMILAGLLVAMWILPFTWPAAIAGTAVFLGISVPLLIIMVFMTKYLHVNINSPIPSLPGPGQCFDKNTLLLMNDGSYKPIGEIEVGDVLINNNMVTGKMKLDASTEQMFKLGEVVVSGSHFVLFNGDWIFVKDHPERKPVSTFCGPYIYCINTSLKTIEIDGRVFADWDDIFEDDKKELLCHLDIDDPAFIHRYYDGGFYPDVKIELENGELREMRDLEIGDVLKDNCKVLGLVEIDCRNLEQKKGDSHGINLQTVFFNESGSLEKESFLYQGEKLFHLITDKKYFYVNGIKYYYYNSCVDLFLEKNRRKLLSIKYV
jgi:hypothetical protein